MALSSVEMPRTALIERLEENLEVHLADYREAKAEYRRKVVQAAHEALAEVERQFHEDDEIDVRQPWAEIVGLPKPRSHEDEYRLAIAMLRDDVREHVELDDVQYRELVMDDWSWKREFLATNSRYGVGA